MHAVYVPVAVVVGLALGAQVVYLLMRSRVVRLETELKHEKQSAEEKLQIIQEARESLSERFKALSSDVLRDNSQMFLDQAKGALEEVRKLADRDLEGRQKEVATLVDPIRKALEQVNSEINDMEKARREAYGDLMSQVRHLSSAHENLKLETVKLVRALRSPKVGGMWGEIQLKRVVELAGMQEHCDFVEQQMTTGAERRLIPDLVVHLPGGRKVVIDAKVSTEAYLKALETDDESEKASQLSAFAGHVKGHIKSLGDKAYWSHIPEATEFVVMFLPGENFFSAALEQDAGLTEYGVERKVILATPTTLISLLKAIAYGWRQETLARSALTISQLGKELYERLSVLTDHFTGVGKGLDRAIDSYNQAVGSLERMVLPSARRFKELGVESSKEIGDTAKIDKSSRAIQAPELTEGGEEAVTEEQEQ